MNLDAIAPRRSFNDYKGKWEDEHAVIFGMTRFGKTYLVERLIAKRRFIAIHDPKAEYVLRGFKTYEKITDLIRASDTEAKIETNAKLIYQPASKEMRDVGAQQAFFAWAYARGQTVIVVDELNALTTGRTDMPDSMLDCYARGNARGVAIWGLTQEPVYVPNIALTQARRRYTFFVALDPHQKKVCSVMPGLTPEAISALPKKHFYYYEQGEKLSAGPFIIKGPTLSKA